MSSLTNMRLTGVSYEDNVRSGCPKNKSSLPFTLSVPLILKCSDSCINPTWAPHNLVPKSCPLSPLLSGKEVLNGGQQGGSAADPGGPFFNLFQIPGWPLIAQPTGSDSFDIVIEISCTEPETRVALFLSRSQQASDGKLQTPRSNQLKCFSDGWHELSPLVCTGFIGCTGCSEDHSQYIQSIE